MGVPSSAMTKDGCIVQEREVEVLVLLLFLFFFCSSRISHDSLRPLACEYTDTPSSSHSPIVAAPYNAVLPTQLPVLPTTHLHRGTAAGLDSCRLFPSISLPGAIF